MGDERTPGRPATRRYSPEGKVRAVRLVRQLGEGHGTVQRVAGQIGCGVESLRAWVRRADIDEGVQPGVVSVRERRIGCWSRRTGSCAGRVICWSGFRLSSRRSSAAPGDDRRVRRGEPRRVRSRVHLQAPAGGSGQLLRRQAAPGRDVGAGGAGRGDDAGSAGAAGGEPEGLRRAQAAEGGPPRRPRCRPGPGRPADAPAGIEGVSRARKKIFTTRADPGASRAPGLVSRQFTATRPDALRVTDLTYVPARSGMACVCFIVGAFSRSIVGWRVAANMTTETVPDALEMARACRGGRRLAGLVAHSDAGSQFTSVRFTGRLEETGARPSTGTVAGSSDNALAETTNGLCKTECACGPGTRGWADTDELEPATLSRVHWFNETRLHGHCGDIPPAEYEAEFYAAQQDHPAGVGTQ
jgi:transposase InsO family protein